MFIFTCVFCHYLQFKSGMLDFAPVINCKQISKSKKIQNLSHNVNTSPNIDLGPKIQNDISRYNL